MIRSADALVRISVAVNSRLETRNPQLECHMRVPFTNLNLSLRAADHPSAPPTGELGWSGLNVFAGIVSEEYNSALTGTTALDTYDKMLRGDTQVRMVEAVINLPVRSAPVSVQPAGDSATDREAAELVETNLLTGMTTHWDDFLREAVGATMWGFEIFEKVFEERDGYIMLRKLAPRHQRTVERWFFDDAGGVSGFRQSGTDLNGAMRERDLPIERLVIYTWDKRKGNPDGLGLLRTMYKPWFCKDFLYKVLNVGLERFWQGIPKGTLPPNFTDADKDEFLALLKRIRAGEDAGFVLPPGYDVSLLEGFSHAGQDIIMSAIEHYDVQIARTALAQWVNLGMTQTGARAVADPMIEIFVAAEDTVGKWFVAHVNRYVIPPLCQYNWPGLNQYPQLAIGDIGSFLNRPAVADGLSKLAGSALITPDEDVEARVRELFDLPDLPEGGRPDEPDGNSSGEPSEEPSDDDAGARAHVAADIDPARLAAAEQIRERLDLEESSLSTDLESAIEGQLRAISRELKPFVEGAARGGANARNRLLKRLRELEIPRQAAYERTILSHLEQIITGGAQAGAQSIGRRRTPDVVRELRPLLAQEAAALADKHAADLRFALRTQVSRDLDQGLSAGQVVWNVEQAARARASINMGATLTEAADRLAQAVARAMET